MRGVFYRLDSERTAHSKTGPNAHVLKKRSKSFHFKLQSNQWRKFHLVGLYLSPLFQLRIRWAETPQAKSCLLEVTGNPLPGVGLKSQLESECVTNAWYLRDRRDAQIGFDKAADAKGKSRFWHLEREQRMELPPSWVTEAVEAESFQNLTPQTERVNFKTPEVNRANFFLGVQCQVSIHLSRGTLEFSSLISFLNS